MKNIFDFRASDFYDTDSLLEIMLKEKMEHFVIDGKLYIGNIIPKSEHVGVCFNVDVNSGILKLKNNPYINDGGFDIEDDILLDVFTQKAKDYIEEKKENILIYLHYNQVGNLVSYDDKEKVKDLINNIASSEWGNSIEGYVMLCSNEVLDDKEFAMFCVNKNPDTIKFFKNFKNDKELFLKAMKKNADVYWYAGVHLKSDVDIIKMALRSDNEAVHYLKEPFASDNTLLKECLDINPECFEYFTDTMKKNLDIATYALQKDPALFYLVDHSLKDDYGITAELFLKNAELFKSSLAYKVKYATLSDAVTAVKDNGLNLKYCSDNVRNDTYVCLEAVKQDGMALRYVPEYLIDNKTEIALEAVRNNGYALYHISEEFQNNHIEIVLEALINGDSQQSMVDNFVSDQLKEIYGTDVSEFIDNLSAELGLENVPNFSKHMKDSDDCDYGKIFSNHN